MQNLKSKSFTGTTFLICSGKTPCALAVAFAPDATGYVALNAMNATLSTRK